MKVLVIGSYAPSLVNFRGSLLEALASRGHSVVAVAPGCPQVGAVKQQLSAINVRFLPIPFARVGLNPLIDFWTICRLVYLLIIENPDHVLAYTVKPVIYTGFAVRFYRSLCWFGRPLCSAALITGLGYVFAAAGSDCRKRSLLQLLLKSFYREGLRASRVIFFQNPDDQHEFQSLGILPSDAKIFQTSGSGVDLELFPPSAVANSHVFLMLARLLSDKGVGEYVRAAQLVKARFPEVVFRLGGPLDPSPAGISKQKLDTWVDEGVVHYLGDLHRVQDALKECRYYVLPSYYREGTPRSLLEAMATGRPIITTDSPGCRQTVLNGVNGFLVQPREAEALADAMVRLIEQPESETQRMAQASLDLARERYDVHKVNAQMLQAMHL